MVPNIEKFPVPSFFKTFEVGFAIGNLVGNFSGTSKNAF